MSPFELQNLAKWVSDGVAFTTVGRESHAELLDASAGKHPDLLLFWIPCIAIPGTECCDRHDGNATDQQLLLEENSPKRLYKNERSDVVAERWSVAERETCLQVKSSTEGLDGLDAPVSTFDRNIDRIA